MMRFIVKRQQYPGTCMNALWTEYLTVDADCPQLEAVLRSGGQGGGPDGDAFDRYELINVEVASPEDKK